MATFSGTTAMLIPIGERTIKHLPQSKINIGQDMPHLMCKAITFKSYKIIKKMDHIKRMGTSSLTIKGCHWISEKIWCGISISDQKGPLAYLVISQNWIFDQPPSKLNASKLHTSIYTKD